jgi:PAS domain S-box-containing protein
MRFISIIIAAVLLVISISFLAYEIYSFRVDTKARLSTIGKILGANSKSVLIFNNAEGARGVLSAISAERQIVAAALYDRYGRLFSYYSVGNEQPVFPDKPGLPGYQFKGSFIQGFQPITVDSKQLGTLYLRSSMDGMYDRLRLFLLVVACVVALSFLLAYLLSRILQKRISSPILELADTAKRISEQENYAIRANKKGNDELGSLTDAFNYMLERMQGHIQKQHDAEQERAVILKKLSDSEEHSRSMIEQLPNPVVRYAPDGSFTYANLAWEQMWQDKRENVKDYNIRKDPQMIASGLSHFVEKAFAGKVALSEPFQYDPGLIGKTGRVRWIQMLLYPLKNADDKIVEVILILMDITANKEAEKIVKESEEKFRSMIERISDAFITIDKNWVYTYVNNRAAELSGHTAEYLVGKNVWEVFPEGIGQPFYNELHKAMKTQQPAHVELYYPPTNKWYEDYIYPTPDSVSVYYHEITQKKNNELALKQSEEKYRQLNEELRTLSAHLQSVREQERMKMAREIHDQLGQQLTVMKMDAAWLDKKLTAKDPAIKEKIESLKEILDETVKMVRKIASELRPGLLDDLGLLAAIEWHVEDFGKRSGIAVESISSKPEPRLPDNSKIGLYRIVQESLTNVARYARARKVIVRTEYHNKDLILTIQDDGVGFDQAAVTANKTLGLLGMRERTNMMGGRFEIISSPGKGTMVVVRVPVE